jgi:hypothetical protein
MPTEESPYSTAIRQTIRQWQQLNNRIEPPDAAGSLVAMLSDLVDKSIHAARLNEVLVVAKRVSEMSALGDPDSISNFSLDRRTRDAIVAWLREIRLKEL